MVAVFVLMRLKILLYDIIKRVRSHIRLVTPASNFKLSNNSSVITLFV